MEVTSAASFAAGFYLPEGQEQHLALSLAGCPGTARMVAVGGLVLNETRFVAEHPTTPWQHLNERPVVELSFMLAGTLRQSQTGLLHEQLYAPGYHNWVFNPQSLEQNQLLGTGQFRLVTVQVPVARMVSLLTDYVPELSDVAEQLALGRPLARHAPAPGLPPSLRYLLDTLWDSPAPLGLKRLHYEALALELVAQQCALWLSSGPAAPPLGAPERDKLHYARALLLQHLSEPPSLAKLARECQLNEFSLKRGFRQLFGTSVGHFVQTQRLEVARHLLLGGGQTVTEIAYQLGYTHPQHFHRAFKKQFGCTPKQLTR
ncbi:helix-turn-helix domain-containing protein [Hymenobacter sp. HMF4947]|uniref:Helix-turn-helix domain-containing protein n=1 Tax=Hymenobacter ginkgonis TaxID=2682976 RepID=A0A7K1TGM0_9BACT|nr:AraC family transcriptional regulator [Hymenobacter ginkgonis]MVN77567.1 helix-turn-helix domain-containing protein [Hymenobacter ginkgonis]